MFSEQVIIKFDDAREVVYDFDMLEELELAYAIINVYIALIISSGVFLCINKKSLLYLLRTTFFPLLISWACVTISLSAAWRNIFSNLTTGKALDAIISFN